MLGGTGGLVGQQDLAAAGRDRQQARRPHELLVAGQITLERKQVIPFRRKPEILEL